MADKVSQFTLMAATSKVLEFAPYAAEVRACVRGIIESPAFKGSRRSQQFLQCVIEKAIAGHADHLKERSLGVELFGRPASYDTGVDAIVRVTASEVRRRLQQFYAETGFDSEFRIDLLSGSYIPKFRRLAAPALIPSAPTVGPETAAVPEEERHTAWRSRLRVLRLVLYAIGVIFVGSSAWLWHQHNSTSYPSPKNLLPWSALLQRDRQIHLVFSDPDISTVQELLGFHISLSDYANRRYVPDPQPPAANMRQGLSSRRGVDVALVDVGIALRISELALTYSEHVKTHNARSLRLEDFKTEDNFVLLGSPRSDPWVGLFQDQLDFEFVYDEKLAREIFRNKRLRQGELPLYVPTAKGWDMGDAFAILAFVGNPSQTGQVLLLAGTNAEGTQAAGELATNWDLLSRTLRRYGIDPNGPVCHFEVLLQVRTMAGSPNAREVIACHRLPSSPSR